MYVVVRDCPWTLNHILCLGGRRTGGQIERADGVLPGGAQALWEVTAREGGATMQLRANSEFLARFFKVSVIFLLDFGCSLGCGFIHHMSTYLPFRFALTCLSAPHLNWNFQLFTKDHPPWIHIIIEQLELRLCLCYFLFCIH